MRIVAGRWRGKTLVVPASGQVRPTADRVRQALFDMLWHSPWAGREAVEGALVLDVFAGTGALGLEALSRGAERAVFIENEAEAVAALRRNIAGVRAEARTEVLTRDATAPGRVRRGAGLVFLDPPYAQGLVPRAMAALRAGGWLAPEALVVAETGRTDEPPHADTLAVRMHGAARVTIWREPPT
jgi:16S rRNA (guanine966-N2)-methyltransferase